MQGHARYAVTDGASSSQSPLHRQIRLAWLLQAGLQLAQGYTHQMQGFRPAMLMRQPACTPSSVCRAGFVRPACRRRPQQNDTDAAALEAFQACCFVQM